MVKNDTKMAGASGSRDQDERRAQSVRLFAHSYSMVLRDMAAVLRGMTKDVLKVAEQQEAKNRHG